MPVPLKFNDNVGETIPADTPHAVSVSLPTWAANVGYEEGQKWVMDKMKCGYPRFFIHKSIDRLATEIVKRHGNPSQKAMLFPTHKVANRCLEFMHRMAPDSQGSARVIDFVPNPKTESHDESQRVLPRLSAVLYPAEHWPVAKQVWQHSGDGVSSRRAEFLEKHLLDGTMVDKASIYDKPRKGPRRYQRQMSIDTPNQSPPSENDDKDGTDPFAFVEERFGRNLNVQFAKQAKLAIRRRIAGSLTSDVDLQEALKHPEDVERTRSAEGFSVDDVFLYPTGMSAIFNTHRSMMAIRPKNKSISYGFPYVDTLKILEKWGPGALFYGNGEQDDLDDLEKRLESGERFLGLFCEFPSNPLLKCPNLQRIRQLADKYDFAVVIDETIGNFLNVHVLPYADVVVSSLTKVFSGDSNVMGGSAILNPAGRYYDTLKKYLAQDYEDNFFEEDAMFLERNSRDFVVRIARINTNAEAICEVLMQHPRIKQVNYPKHAPTRKYYDACRLPNGGYGGLLSATFYSMDDAMVFYDNLDTAKGPSLGTNFTLSSPFALLAHYTELDWAASFGVEANLVRFSVGLEDTEALKKVFQTALDAIIESDTNGNGVQA
ncbi:PLP-dependent transferase [Aureobasidium pullulans]|uniref:cystathionine gamma-synthase n=1 Tax=Aureobasidium pullulans TaxID=5580 RepID=A0A4S9A501_AURPU|nr:PLP-dependent transferase [Aureobasidium pullulans]